jgi:hypothetical protein
MPRPWSLIRYIAAAYSLCVSALMAPLVIWNLITIHAVVPPGPSRPDTPFSTGLFVAWLVCTAVTGWYGMDREAGQ